MINFIKCPCCSGGEAIGMRTADTLATLIERHLAQWAGTLDCATAVELENIANTVRNYQQRESPPAATDDDPLLA